MSVPLVALRQMVRDRLGVPPHDQFFKDTVLDTNINLAMMTLEGEHLWPWSEEADEILLDNTGEFDVPSRWRATRAIIVAGRELRELPHYELLYRYDPDQRYTAEPAFFSVVARTVHFRPIPAKSIPAVHLYYIEPTVLAADTDKPALPMQHIGVLVAKAAQLCSVREDDRPSADTHLAEYLQGVDRMRGETRSVSRPSQVRVRPGSWT